MGLGVHSVSVCDVPIVRLTIGLAWTTSCGGPPAKAGRAAFPRGRALFPPRGRASGPVGPTISGELCEPCPVHLERSDYPFCFEGGRANTRRGLARTPGPVS